jgi:hypothetical protein
VVVSKCRGVLTVWRHSGSEQSTPENVTITVLHWIGRNEREEGGFLFDERAAQEHCFNEILVTFLHDSLSKKSA